MHQKEFELQINTIRKEFSDLILKIEILAQSANLANEKNELENIITNDEIPRMLTIKEASEYVGLSSFAIRSMCKNEKVKFIKSGNKYYINEESLILYLKKGDRENEKGS